MFTCKTTDTQSQKFQGRQIKGVLCTAYLFAASAGTAMTGVLVDQTRIRLRAIIKRANGVEREIYNDQIRYANAISGFNLPFFEFFQNSTLEIQTANASGVVQTGSIPMYVDFKKTYHLEAGDSLFIEVNTTGFTSDASVSSTASYLEVYEVDSTDQETDAQDCEFGIYNIQAGKTADVVNLGDGVTEILFINFDKSSILTADSPIATVSIDSKQFKVTNLTFQGLLANRQRIFPSKALSDVRYQSHMLYSGVPIDGARVDLTLNGSNVNASSCYIVWRKQPVTATTLARGQRHAAQKNANVLTSAGLHSQAANHLASAGVKNPATWSR